MSKSKKQFRVQEASYVLPNRTSPTKRERNEVDNKTGNRIDNQPDARGRDTARDTAHAHAQDSTQDSVHHPVTDSGTDSVADSVAEADRTQVELWVAELVVMARELTRSLEPRPQSALRALAVWARLARVEPRALPVPTHPNLLAQACTCVVDNAAQLVEAITSIATEHANIWLDRAGRLHQSYLGAGGLHPRDQEKAASSLLRDLDEMELTDYAAAELDHRSVSFSEAVMRCRYWLTENVNMFLSCGKAIAAELRVMRRDLPTVNWALSQTVHKYLEIRSAIEEMEQDLSFAPLAASQEQIQ